MRAREQPIEQGGTRAADVQIARRRRGETRDDRGEIGAQARLLHQKKNGRNRRGGL